MPTVLITGGTGLIGTALTKALLGKGYSVTILTRKKKKPFPGTGPQPHYAEWDTEKGFIEEQAVRTADHIVHLAGANAGEKKWTRKRKQEIINSRVKTAELIVKSLQEIPNQVQSVISSSAIGWYGPDDPLRPVPFTEEFPPADNFLGSTCRLWEQAVNPVSKLGKRLVIFRTGMVLSRQAGYYKELRKPISFGLATILGNGRQVVSWIHVDDLVRMYIKAIETDQLSGVYNAVAPHPVSNKELALAIGKKVKGRFFIPVYVPSLALKMVLGEMSIEILKSATVSCQKMHKTGFVFLYPSPEAAISALEAE